MDTVLCIGAATVDHIAVVNRTPGPDERVTADALVRGFGGPAATAAVALARLGTSAAFCGVVGDDEAGEAVRANLVAAGVNVEHLRVLRGQETAQSIIIVNSATHTRTIITRQATGGAEDIVVPRGGWAWIHADHLGYGPAVAAELPGLLSVDGGNPIPSLDLSDVDLYAPSAAELCRVTGFDRVEEALVSAQQSGARRVVATAGAEGAWVREAGVTARIPAFDRALRSTLGAGDVFHGGLLAAIVAGHALPAAVRRASMTAVLSCSAIDGQSGIPDRQELNAALNDPTAPND